MVKIFWAYIIEKEKFSNSKNDIITNDNIFNLPKADALDSLNRIEEIIAEGDIEILNRFISASEKGINDIVSESLEKLKKQGNLSDYGIIVNSDRKKTGLPRHKDLLNEIYLYNDYEYYTFDEYNSLKQQIDAIYKNIPWLYIYIAPGKQGTNINDLSETVLNEIATNIALYIKKRFDELFPNKPICTQWIHYIIVETIIINISGGFCMCKINSGASIKNRQDVQNLVIATIFRQEKAYYIENILNLVQQHMIGSSVDIQKEDLYSIILDNLDILYIKNKVKCKNGCYTPQPLKRQYLNS